MTLEKDESMIKEEDDNRDDFQILFIDGDTDMCVTARIAIYTKKYPTWSQRKVVAAAQAYCKKTRKKLGDAMPNISKSEILDRVRSISLTRFATLIRALKTKKGMKVAHMGLLPFKTELPMKNINRLQTKMEKLATEEQKFLTEEELSQRSQYATHMKKQDAELFGDWIDSYVIDYPDKEQEIYQTLMDSMKKDNYMVYSDTVMKNINTGLNNIIKFPIVLAVEMITEYYDKQPDGSIVTQYHFKPYKELEKSIMGVDKLPIMVEHQDAATEINTIGYVKNLRADPIRRGICGMGYAPERKLPNIVKEAIKLGIPIPVSIGFMAQLGDSGEFNGKKYSHTQENIILNHLAICLESIARCSVPNCGINIGSEVISDSGKTTVIKDNNDYIINLCNLNKIEDSKSQLTNIKEGDNMEDGFANPKSGKISAGNEPEDFDKWLTKFRAYINGVTEKELQAKYKKRIIKAFTDGDKNMDEKELKSLQDSIADKDEQIKKLEDAVKVYEEEKKTALKNELKKWSSKFEDAELDNMSLPELALTVKIASKFEPSQEKPTVIPVGTKTKKEDATQSKREDPSNIFAETNKKFDMSGLD